ncbi:hypothetical protein [Pseudomonas rossensis]|uniref:hypothetical protein n=1 Tax=Pseudomonas rossensis TaxID=2305471 RepID=UPI00326117A5
MKSASASLYSLALFLAALTPAWAATESSHSSDQGKHWLVEKTSDDSRFQTALLSGNTRYDGKTGEALLAISCHPDNPMSMSLTIPTQRLGFNADDYEGPGAPANGPLRLTTSTRAPISYLVSGWGSVRSLQGDGWVFEFGMTINKRELHYWLTDTAHGQRVTLTLPSRKSDTPLIAEFVLPEDDSGLRKAIGPCL